MTPRGPSLRDAWDSSADDWLRWARSSELDHAFWRMNLPTLLSLLLAPSEHGALDVGCGEGRVARAMKERGHRVTGIEFSAALAAAARDSDPEFAVEVADAAAMPFASARFDLAVASLSLMNMDEMPTVLSEIARVLRPRGCLYFSILHPINTWRDAGQGYFQTLRYSETLERGGERLTVHDTHRPLQEYLDGAADAGFLVERIVEPMPDEDYVAEVPEAAHWRERPGFLHARCWLTS
jgi:ubiquinone/menaquinone biosynthesis C-methylase UbiE